MAASWSSDREIQSGDMDGQQLINHTEHFLVDGLNNDGRESLLPSIYDQTTICHQNTSICDQTTVCYGNTSSDDESILAKDESKPSTLTVDVGNGCINDQTTILYCDGNKSYESSLDMFYDSRSEISSADSSVVILSPDRPIASSSTKKTNKGDQIVPSAVKKKVTKSEINQLALDVQQKINIPKKSDPIVTMIPSTSKEAPSRAIIAHGSKLVEEPKLIVSSQQKEEGATALLREEVEPRASASASLLQPVIIGTLSFPNTRPKATSCLDVQVLIKEWGYSIDEVQEKDVHGPFETRRRVTRTQRLQPMQAEFKPVEPGSYVGSIEYEVVDSPIILVVNCKGDCIGKKSAK